MIKKIFKSYYLLKNNNKGFTLTELLVVIAIIGILVATISVNYSSARISARDTKRKTDMENVAAAVELYYSQFKNYPNSNTSPTVSNYSELINELRTKGYITTEPVDPKNIDFYIYNYYSDSAGSEFVVYARLENEKEQITLSGVNIYNDNLSLGSGVYGIGNERYYRVVGK